MASEDSRLSIDRAPDSECSKPRLVEILAASPDEFGPFLLIVRTGRIFTATSSFEG